MGLVVPYISKKCFSIILKGRPDELGFGSMCLLDSMRYISERTDSKADSTLDMLSADVSMYIMPFSTIMIWPSGRVISAMLSQAGE